MCDFREFNAIYIIETGEVVKFDQKSLPHLDYIPPSGVHPGMYHIGMSGCGYQYFDGHRWLSEYNGYSHKGTYYIVDGSGKFTYWGIEDDTACPFPDTMRGKVREFIFGERI